MATTLSRCTTISAPAATQTGIAGGCMQWHVAKPGDYCLSVALEYNINVDSFMGQNPAVDAPSCSKLLTGNAYCVKTCDSALTTSTSELAVQRVNNKAVVNDNFDTTTNTANNRPSPSTTYHTHKGDGTPSSHWPPQSSWLPSYESMFTTLLPAMHCDPKWYVADNSDTETSALHDAILSTSKSSNVDARFILAIVMQESRGCVRAPTANNGHDNPGLAQSHAGKGSCNPNGGAPRTPCPTTEIQTMIDEGVAGTETGDGLKQLLKQQEDEGYTDVDKYYRAARAYNSGSILDPADLGVAPGSTACYVSDVANWLTGWDGKDGKCDDAALRLKRRGVGRGLMGSI